MEYSYKFRIYPNAEQENLIHRTFGCCRYVYNHYLSKRMELYKENGSTMNYVACAKDLTQLKRELPWLAEVDVTALQSSLRNLDNAFQNFFRRVKNKERPYGYPKFKSKHVHRKSYVSKNNHGTIALSDKKIRLPKLGMVKCRISKEVQGRILSATVSQNPSGKYFVSLCCTEVEIEKLPAAGKVTGVDLGVKALATTAEGDIYPNNKYLNQSDKKLRRFARRLSRKKKGSRNYEKARIRKARLEEHIANQRRDDIQKATTDLIRKYDVICLEDLKTKGMMNDHRLARSIGDASFFEFRRELEYKAEFYGREVTVIDVFSDVQSLRIPQSGYQRSES